jgi:hypothetical protein
MSDTFCPIPWLFQAARNNGDLRLCCQANVSDGSGLLADENGAVYNANDCNLEESRNAPLISAVRKNMLLNKWSSSCQRCKSEEEAGLRSRRTYEREAWSLTLEEAAAHTDGNGKIDSQKLPVRYLDLRFGNKCNLACRMCGPTDSDFWYSDYSKLTGKNFYQDSHGRVELRRKGQRLVTDDKSYQWFESDKFWEQMARSASGIQHIYMAGGEPLLIDQHYKYLEGCIKRGYSKNMIIEYNTNMTVLPDKALELWKHFRQVRVGASVDGFGEVFELQRYPAKWSTVFKNLKKLDAQPDHIISWLACTVTVYNVLHLPEFMRWKVKESGFVRINSTKRRPIITHHVAHRPKHLNIRVLSDQQKAIVCDTFEKSKSQFRLEFTDAQLLAASEILDSVVKYMLSESYYASHGQEMLAFSDRLDDIRSQSSQKFLP